MARIIISLLFFFSTTALGQTKGNLENPAQDSYMSGIYLFSGWACDAELIEIVIDGGSGLKAAYGTSRGDTQSVCGDSDNGFGLLWNFENLEPGTHEAVAFADGVEIGRTEFTSTQIISGGFLRGATGETVLNGFPEAGREVSLKWDQAAQNFLIAAEREALDPFQIEGPWHSAQFGVTGHFSTVRNGDTIDITALVHQAGVDGVTVWEGPLLGRASILSTPEGFEPAQEIEIWWSDDGTRMRVTGVSCEGAGECTLLPGQRFAVDRGWTSP